MIGVDDMFDPTSMQETVRRDVFTRLMIKSTGVLPVEMRDREFPRILDIGCGPGTWIYEASFHSPRSLFVGTDTSPALLKDAAVRNNLRSMCSFHVWDPFSGDAAPFAEESFDLITLHFASQWVPNQLTWLQLIQTCRLYLRRGGVLLLQDNEGVVTTSPALGRLGDLTQTAYKTSQRNFVQGATHQGWIVALMGLLRHAHFPHPAVSMASVDFSYSHEEENYAWRDYLRVHIHEITPWLVATGVTTPEELCTLSISLDGEMFREDFCGIWTTFSVVARKP